MRYPNGWIPSYTAGSNTAWVADWTWNNGITTAVEYLQPALMLPSSPPVVPSLETEMEWLCRRVTEICDLVPA